MPPRLSRRNAVIRTWRALARSSAPGPQVEEGIGIQLPGGRAVAAADVVDIDLEFGFGIDLGRRREQEIAVGERGIAAGGAGLDDDLAVEDAVAVVVGDAPEILRGWSCGAPGAPAGCGCRCGGGHRRGTGHQPRRSAPAPASVTRPRSCRLSWPPRSTLVTVTAADSATRVHVWSPSASRRRQVLDADQIHLAAAAPDLDLGDGIHQGRLPRRVLQDQGETGCRAPTSTSSRGWASWCRFRRARSRTWTAWGPALPAVVAMSTTSPQQGRIQVHAAVDRRVIRRCQSRLSARRGAIRALAAAATGRSGPAGFPPAGAGAVQRTSVHGDEQPAVDPEA